MVRHPGARSQGVNLREYEIAAIADAVSASISPEQLATLMFSKELVSISTYRGRIVYKTLYAGKSSWPPINRFPVVVICHCLWVVTENLSEPV
jgi:hypothetical protein